MNNYKFEEQLTGLRSHTWAILSFTLGSSIKLTFFFFLFLKFLIVQEPIRMISSILIAFPLAFGFFKIATTTERPWIKFFISAFNFGIYLMVFDIKHHPDIFYVI